MRAAVPLQACIPILNLGLKWYADWKTIVIVAAGFSQKQRQVDTSGVVHDWKEMHVGESRVKGPVVLSWKDVQASGRIDRFNVVIHEAAHRLDLLDGAMNGRPALHGDMSPRGALAEYPRVYELLKAFYRQDPAARTASRYAPQPAPV
jgi:Mlc titration factor MtfA (ptsG expression regulator)